MQAEENVFKVLPSIGWGNVRLGDSRHSVQHSLSTSGIVFKSATATYCWDLNKYACTLWFEAGPPERLAQIVLSNLKTQVNQFCIIGLSLDEALQRLEVHSYDDTLWSAVDVDSEYVNGVPMEDSQRPTDCDIEILLDGGTLWIKSLGLGLNTVNGGVGGLVVRRVEDVPQIGCGPLTAEALLAAHHPELQRAFAQDMSMQQRSEASKKAGTDGIKKSIAMAIAILLLAAFAYMFLVNR